MKRLNILLVLFFYMQVAIAYELKTDTVLTIDKNIITEQIIVSVKNTEKELLWLWVDDKDNNMVDSIAIRNYLMKRHGDFSIFDIGTDSNMEGCWWHPSSPKELFVKCIEPNHLFILILYKELENVDMKEKKHISVDSIKIYSNSQIIKYCPGIDSPWGINRISYPYDCIAFRCGVGTSTCLDL